MVLFRGTLADAIIHRVVPPLGTHRLVEDRMSEELHVALPKLYGAPAYARPPRPIEISGRPFDEDDLPLEAFRSDEDLMLVADLSQPIELPPAPAPPSSSGGILPRILDLRSLTRSR